MHGQNKLSRSVLRPYKRGDTCVETEYRLDGPDWDGRLEKVTRQRSRMEESWED
jgi:hypothetical protein